VHHQPLIVETDFDIGETVTVGADEAFELPAIELHRSWTGHAQSQKLL
jgi:hypothetical protein